MERGVFKATITATERPQQVSKPRAGILQQLWGSRIAYLYIIPAVAVMFVITVIPILYQVYISFTDFGIKNLKVGSAAPNFVGLNNYVKVLTNNVNITNYDFWRILQFNIVWTVVNVFFHVVIGVGVAVLLNRKRLFGRKFYRSIFLIPWAMPAFVIAVVWRNMYNTQDGAINQLLSAIVGHPVLIPWLENNAADPIPFISLLPLSFFAALITNIWLGWPFMSVVATGALQSVPGELYEASTIDGATKWQQFWNVTVPMIRPAMIPAIMLGTIWTFNAFNLIYFITEGGPFGRTEILVTEAYKMVNPGRVYGVAAAFSIIVFFILLVITLINNRVTRATESLYA